MSAGTAPFFKVGHLRATAEPLRDMTLSRYVSSLHLTLTFNSISKKSRAVEVRVS